MPQITITVTRSNMENDKVVLYGRGLTIKQDLDKNPELEAVVSEVINYHLNTTTPTTVTELVADPKDIDVITNLLVEELKRLADFTKARDSKKKDSLKSSKGR